MSRRRIALVVAGVVALGALSAAIVDLTVSVRQAKAVSEAISEEVAEEARAMPPGGYDAYHYCVQAEEYRALAEESRDATSRLATIVTLGLANNSSIREAEWLEDRADYAEDLGHC